jgi:GPH family glycoside/pentoside/hexuronide:cation symporter
MDKKPLSKALKYFFGAGDFMYSLSVSFKTYYWTYFLTTVIALPLAAVGVMNTIINVFDFVMAFCWGAIIDSMRPGKYGRYRTVLLFMAPLIVISHAFQWFAPTLYAYGFNATVAVVATCICFGIYIVFFNFAWCANVSLIGVCASSEADRGRLSGNRNAYNKACNVVVAYIAAFLLGLFKNEVIGYAAAATILGALTIPGYYLHVYLTKGYEKTRAELESEGEAGKKKANRITLKDIITVIKSNAQILWVLVHHESWTFRSVCFLSDRYEHCGGSGISFVQHTGKEGSDQEDRAAWFGPGYCGNFGSMGYCKIG